MLKTKAGRAYSYVRFSSHLQADGGSLARQTRLTAEYCQRRGLVLDEDLKLDDLGVSAFRGANVREGALAGFLEACRTGRVQRGSTLVVESLDRLSRDEIRPALQLFLSLQDYGITIVTHEPPREYDPAATDALALIEPLIVFARAHEESKMKSHRRRDGWKQAKDRARQGEGPMLKTCPAWLEVVDGAFRAKEEAAAAVRLIFQLACDGYGVNRIATYLVVNNVPPIYGRVLDDEAVLKHRADRQAAGVPLTSEEEENLGRMGRWATTEAVPGAGPRKGKKVKVRTWVPSRWVVPYVYRILSNPAAKGAYQPNRQDGKKVVPEGPPVDSYYPEVVSAETWERAQVGLKQRSGDHAADGRFRKGGKASRAAGRRGVDECNLFTGIVRDARTGERMRVVNACGRKTDVPRKRYRYLCATQETGAPATGGRIDVNVFEAAILKELKELKPADISGDAAPSDVQGEIGRHEGRLLDIDARLARTRQRARSDDDFDSFLDLIKELQDERKIVSEELAKLREVEPRRAGADLGEVQTIAGLLERAKPEERVELRRRLKARLQQLVSEMLVLVVALDHMNRAAAVQVHFTGGRTRNYLILHSARPQRWEVATFAGAGLSDGLDLRKKKDRESLERSIIKAGKRANLAEE